MVSKLGVKCGTITTEMKHGKAAMMILQLPTEAVVGGTEHCGVRLRGYSNNRAIRKKLVADERNKQKSMRKREIEGLGFCLRRAH
jgi:hypothetical protein